MEKTKPIQNPQRKIQGQKGAAGVEYGILLSLIGVLSITAVVEFGGSLNTTFETAQTTLADANNGTLADGNNGQGVGETRTPQRTASLVDGTSFEAFDCLVGTPGFDTDENDPVFTARFFEADCFDGMGGDEEIEVDEGSGPNMLLYVYPDLEEADIYSGAHWLETSNLAGGTGTAGISGLAAGTVIDFSWINQADVTLSGRRDNLILTPNNGASLEAYGVLQNPDTIRIGFADGTTTVTPLLSQVTNFQGSDTQQDYIQGTILADTIRTGLAGATVSPGTGADVIYHEGGSSSFFGEFGSEEKTVHMVGFNFADIVSVTNPGTGFGSNYTISLNGSTVNIGETNLYTTFVFEDGPRTEAEVIALAP